MTPKILVASPKREGSKERLIIAASTESPRSTGSCISIPMLKKPKIQAATMAVNGYASTLAIKPARRPLYHVTRFALFTMKCQQMTMLSIGPILNRMLIPRALYQTSGGQFGRYVTPGELRPCLTPTKSAGAMSVSAPVPPAIHNQKSLLRRLFSSMLLTLVVILHSPLSSAMMLCLREEHENVL